MLRFVLVFLVASQTLAGAATAASHRDAVAAAEQSRPLSLLRLSVEREDQAGVRDDLAIVHDDGKGMTPGSATAATAQSKGPADTLRGAVPFVDHKNADATGDREAPVDVDDGLGAHPTVVAADSGRTKAFHVQSSAPQEATDMAIGAFSEIVQKELSGPQYQSELPGVGAVQGRPTTLDEGTFEPPSNEPPSPLPDQTETPIGPFLELGEVVRVLLWAIILVGGALLAFQIVTVFMRRARQDPSEPHVADDQESSVPDFSGRQLDETMLDKADGLARGGKYGEAIHTLLLHSFDELQRVADRNLSQSLTSREIVTIANLTTDAKAALAFLVGLVELSHFGGRVCGEPEYRKAREHYRQFQGVAGGTA